MSPTTRREVRPWLVLLGLVLGLGGSCSGRSAPGAGSGSAAGPAAAPGFRTPRPLDVISGVVPIEVVGDGLELRVPGQPPVVLAAGKGRLDTSRLSDGLHQLALTRPGDARALATLPVVVLNQGSEVFFKNGSDGEIVVPPAGYQEQHLRYHWDMPAGVKRVLGILSFTGAGFELELALGTGTCPHHGTAVAKQVGSTSPITLVHEAAATLEPAQWFAHVRLLNPEKVPGRQARFAVRAFMIR